jgi:hypothetical protein
MNEEEKMNLEEEEALKDEELQEVENAEDAEDLEDPEVSVAGEGEDPLEAAQLKIAELQDKYLR